MRNDDELDWVQAEMEAAFLSKAGGRLGGGATNVREVRLLNRIIRWTPTGLLYEADPRHAEQLARDVVQLRCGNAAATGGGRSSLSSPGFRREPAAEEASAPSRPERPEPTEHWRPGRTSCAWIARTLAARPRSAADGCRPPRARTWRRWRAWPGT